MDRVVFKDCNHVDKTIERLKAKNCRNLERLLLRWCCAVGAHRSRSLMACSIGRPRIDHSYGILNNLATSPGSRPFFKNGIPLYRILNPGDKGLLSLRTISCHQTQLQVKPAP